MNDTTKDTSKAVAKQATLPPAVFSVTEETLVKLREKNKELTKVTPENYDQFKDNVRELTTLRTGIESERNEQLKLARQHTDDVNTEAKRVTALVSEIEDPVRKLKTDWDSLQKAAQEKAERKATKRAAMLNGLIDMIEGLGQDLDDMTAEALRERKETLEAEPPLEANFAEFYAVAIERHESSVARLTVAHGRAVARALEAQKLKEAQDALAEEKSKATAKQKIIDDENAEAVKQLALDRELFEKEKQADADQKAADQKAIDEARKAQDDEEMAAIDAEAQATRDAQIAEDAAEAERNRLAQVELDRVAAEAEALALAPDKDKLTHFARQIWDLGEATPTLEHQKANKVLDRARGELERISENLVEWADKL